MSESIPAAPPPSEPEAAAPPKTELSREPAAPPGATRRELVLEERGITASILEWGDAAQPLALLHHANGFCAAQWAEVAEPLADRFRVVAIDARGHGHSPVPPAGITPEGFAWLELRDDLVAVGARLLEELGQSHVALALGHSFGGTLSLLAAARRPERYRAVLALDPVILPPFANGPGRGNELARRTRRRRDVFEARAEARESFAGKALFEGWTERALDLYCEFALGETPDGRLALRCPREVEATVFESGVAFDIAEEVGRIEARAGIAHAVHGNFPVEVHARVVDAIPHGWLDETDAGHLMLMQDPARVLRLVERALGEDGLAG